MWLSLSIKMRESFSGTYVGVCLSPEQNHPGEPGEESDKDVGRRKEKGRGADIKATQQGNYAAHGRLHFPYLNNSRSRRGRRSVRASLRTAAGAHFPSQRAVKRRFSEPGWIPERCATLREIWVRIMKDGLNARGEMNGGGAGRCTGPRLLVDTAISLIGGGNNRPFRKALDLINQMPIWVILSLFFWPCKIPCVVRGEFQHGTLATEDFFFLFISLSLYKEAFIVKLCS